MVIIITITTIIHHVFPSIVQVPNVTGPYIIEPLIIDLVIMDVGAGIISILLIYHGFKTIGKLKTISFLYGSIIFAGIEECIWIFSGRFGLVPPTYFFTRGGLWFFEIPVFTCLGWFTLSYSCYYIARKIFPNRSYFLHAALAGIFAVSLDLFIDPVMVNMGSISIYPSSEGMWIWLTHEDAFRIFSIPFYNFFGWFMVIFMFLVLFNYTLSDKKIDRRGKKKSLLLFYGLIPVFLAVLIVITYLTEAILDPLLVGVDLIPIGIA
jgi:uncharacterized membrane protein